MKKIIFPLFLGLIAIGLLVTDYFLINQDESETQKEEGQVPGIVKAFHFMNDVRSYPGEDIPKDGYTKAYKASMKNSLKSSRFEGVWEQMGPHNIGGRTLDIAFNHQNTNTIFAASASGGLWKSYVGGLGENAWERVPLGHPALAIAAVELSPSDSNIMFVGTGECYGNGEYFPSVSYRATRGLSGIGLLRSIDGGLSWEMSIDWSYEQQRGVQRIKFDPVDHNIVWVATTEGTFKSINQGESWELVHDVIMATDIAINPSNPDLVFVACGGMWSPGGGIYRTQDGGANWELMDMGPGGPSIFGGKARICMAPSSPNMIYASIGKNQSTGSQATWLCASIDNGDNWMVVSNDDYSRFQGWYSHYVAINPENPNHIYCGGVDFWQSFDGGSNLDIDQGNIGDWFHPDWLHSDHHDFEFHPDSANILYVAHDGGVHRTDDGGENFYSCNWGYQTSQFYAGFSCSDTDPDLAMGGLQDNFSCIYEGGMNWRRVIGGDGSFSAISQVDNDEIFGSYQNLSILKSYDGGYNWYSANPGGQNYVNFIAPFALSSVNNTTMYAASSIVHRSNNGGNSWTATNSSTQFYNNPVLSMGVSSTDVDVVYVATMPWYTDPHVYKTTNGGGEWIDITANLPNRYPTDIHVDVNDHSIVYITFGGFGTSHLYRSINSGTTWESIGEGLPDIPGWSVVTDPILPNNIYFGNEFGIFVSIDGGENWEPFMEGLIDAAFAMDLKISVSNRKLRVATHGNGAWERPLIETTVSIGNDLDSGIKEVKLTNWPNPFKNQTSIRYHLNKNSKVNLAIYDISGKLLAELINSNQSAGVQELVWNASDGKGNKLQPGIYICKLTIDNQHYSRKLHIR